MKKVLVVSFQRSGTHFLINNMATNFKGIEDGWIDVVHGPQNPWVKDVRGDNMIEKIREQMISAYFPHPINKCLKSHHQSYFFERHFDEIAAKYDILYMVRDPRDVMVACFNYYNNTNYERFVKDSNFSSFIRASLWNVQTEVQPFSYSHVKPKNIIDKWHKHVLSWLPHKNKGVTFIHFANLKMDPNKTLKYIGDSTCQILNETIKLITVEDSRYRPDFKSSNFERGSVGIWKSFFSTDDLKFLEQSLSSDVRSISCLDDA